MNGLFITFEGTEGGGKSTQIQLLTEHLRAKGRAVRMVREPGGTPIGEEIRHTLKHSEANHAMTGAAELLLMSASRAQLVLEVIQPALASGEIVLCDRFLDSTVAYQGYGRGLDLRQIEAITDFAVGRTKPDLTLLLDVPVSVSEQRRQARQALQTAQAASNTQTTASAPPLRDRMEELDRAFFERVHQGFQQIAAANPARVRVIDATRTIEEVHRSILEAVAPFLASQAASARESNKRSDSANRS